MNIKEKIQKLLSEKYESTSTNLKTSKTALKEAFANFISYAEEIDVEPLIPKINNDLKNTQKLLDDLKKQGLVAGVDVQYTKYKDEGLIYIDLLFPSSDLNKIEQSITEYTKKLYIKPGIKRNLGDNFYSNELKKAKKDLDASVVMRLEFSDFSIG